MSNTFGDNLSFLNLLNLIQKDPNIKAALEKKDFAVIDAYPGLTEQEKTALKVCNWKRVEINLADRDIDEYDPGNLDLASRVFCERNIGPEFAERQCVKESSV